MDTNFNSIHDVLKVLHKFNRGTIITINGRKHQVGNYMNGVHLRVMDVQPPMPMQRPNDGRQFNKVHMSNHKIAQAIKAG